MFRVIVGLSVVLGLTIALAVGQVPNPILIQSSSPTFYLLDAPLNPRTPCHPILIQSSSPTGANLGKSFLGSLLYDLFKEHGEGLGRGVYPQFNFPSREQFQRDADRDRLLRNYRDCVQPDGSAGCYPGSVENLG